MMMPQRHQFLAFVALFSLQISFTESLYHHNLLTLIKQRTAFSQLDLVPQQLGSFKTLEGTVAATNERKVVLEDLVSKNSQRADFHEAWDWQKYVMQQHFDRLLLTQTIPSDDNATPFLSKEQSEQLKDNEGLLTKGGVDTFFMLEHQAVYTLGTGSDEKFITGTDANVPIVRMDRGGEVTYHGPGQLVVYPVVDLREYRQDIHWYMRALEECILIALRAAGVEGAERQDDTTGIWIDNHKVAAVGVKCRKWITMHGLAVNVEDSSLDHFGGIVPCGLEGRSVGCLNQFLAKQGREPLTLAEFSQHMKDALEEVFQVEMQSRVREELPKI